MNSFWADGLITALDPFEHVRGRTLARAEITAPVLVEAKAPAFAITFVTAPALHFDGRTPVLIEARAERFGEGPRTTYVDLWENSADIGCLALTPSAGPLWSGLRRVPSLGVHVYTLRAYVSAGSAWVRPPAYIHISEIRGSD